MVSGTVTPFENVCPFSPDTPDSTIGLVLKISWPRAIAARAGAAPRAARGGTATPPRRPPSPRGGRRTSGRSPPPTPPPQASEGSPDARQPGIACAISSTSSPLLAGERSGEGAVAVQ